MRLIVDIKLVSCHDRHNDQPHSYYFEVIMSNQSSWTEFFSNWFPLIKAAILLIIGLVIITLLSRFIQKKLAKKLGKHVSLLIRHAVFYGGITVIVLMTLLQLGFNVSALLGAAGIFGVTIGFAAQTSASNIISGIFVLLERSFKVGDDINCQEAIGTVQSVDLLSVQIKTYDGQLIRIPNEMVLKNILKNKTFYPHRRISFYVLICHKASLDRAIKVINDICLKNKLILSYPKPSISFNKIDPSGKTLIVNFWTNSNATSQVASEFLQSCSQELDQEKLTVYQNI